MVMFGESVTSLKHQPHTERKGRKTAREEENSRRERKYLGKFFPSRQFLWVVPREGLVQENCLLLPPAQELTVFWSS